jgi:predicted HAD superfamily Cof-like phosphohydrolase
MDDGWKEVIRSNMAKVDPETGFVKKRADGKILKPEGWTPPDLASLIEE